MITEIAQMLPLTLVMVTGPQIITAIFLAMSPDRIRLTAFYIMGAIGGICSVVLFAYLTGFSLSLQIKIPGFLDKIIVALLILAMISIYLNRDKSKKTKKIHKSVSDKKILTTGFILLGFFPTDFLTNLAVGSSLAGQEHKLTYFAAFVLVTCLWLLLPLATVQILGARADSVLETVRQAINKYSWIVTEIICLWIIVMVASK